MRSEISSGCEAIVERAKGGDRLAFSAIYERFAPVVHGVLISGARVDEVDDLMQEVFLDAWRGIRRLRQSEAIGAWLMTIARNRLRKAWKRSRTTCTPLADDLVDGSAAAQKSEAPSGDEILAVLRTLPEAYRETLALRLVEGLTGPEIAATTGMTPGSVRVNLTRGFALLRDKLRREGWP